MIDALNIKQMLESVEPYAQALTSVTVQSNVILEALEYVREQPQIVRCNDCKHGSLYCTEDVCGATLIECNHPDFAETVVVHKWDWFCADGEPKDEHN